MNQLTNRKTIIIFKRLFLKITHSLLLVCLTPRQWRNFGLKSGGTKLEVYL